MTTPIMPAFPRWATGSAADVTEPLEALKTAGWVGGANPDRPAAQHFNWLLKTSYELHSWWAQFLLLRPSTDWISTKTPFAGQDAADAICNAIAYSPTLGIYVAVGGGQVGGANRALIASSPDLAAWTARVTLSAGVTQQGFTSVRWFASTGVFVAIGGDAVMAGRIYYSTNGTAWTIATSGSDTADGGFLDIGYDATNGLYVVCSDTKIHTTPNITTTAWTLRSTVASAQFRSIAVDSDNGITLVSNHNGTDMYRSTNGTTYTGYAMDSSIHDSRVLWDDTGGRFIAVGEISSTDTTLAISTDGTSGSWDVHLAAETGLINTGPVPQIGFNEDYSSLMVAYWDGQLYAMLLGEGAPAFARASPVDSLWTDAHIGGGSTKVVNYYFKPFWDPSPATKAARYWILGGYACSNSNDVLALSQVPIY